MKDWLTFLLAPAHVDIAGVKVDGPVLVAGPVLALLVLVAVATLVWVYRDATRRGKNGLLAMVFILATGYPISFLWWFWLRPRLAEGPGLNSPVRQGG